ncbi:type I restriction-modification system subunit M [Corynebacterium callunae]|uniref:type I restriction-modification system subunit M n=1 Tax=Corynebacterium callunae TaxID=1721 RepID=UPI003982C2D8
MALKKSDLYSSLWASADQLRGGMDASQYKDYILTLLFVKYVSDKAKSDPDSLIDVPEGGSFDDMLAAKGEKDIGDQLNKIIAKLAEANGLRNVIDVADFNDEEKLGKGKEMQDRLSKLVTIFNDIDFRSSGAEGDDLLGDAYEYLMRHFATESGKSKGQFYTPAEVSRILAKVVGIGASTSQDETVYDPAAGSGSLLLKAAAEAPRGMTIYGQEKDNATWALSKMNMILHNNETAEIEKGDTITNPQFVEGDRLQTFDYVVMNPPFSVKAWSNGLEEEYGRFELGMPPEKNGDYAFLLHALTSLKSTGKGAIILPHGVLFRGNAEATIRKELIRRGYIKGIIGLPANLFYGTGIPACIIVIDKENAQARTGIFMIDASKGFIKDGNKNRLRSRDIHQVVTTFNNQLEIDGYSRMVPMGEISDEKNDYNLNIPRYIDSSEPEDLQDLDAHLNGGIPNRDLDLLNEYWNAFPNLRTALFKENRPGYSDLAIEPEDVQQTILNSEDFKEFSSKVDAITEEWKSQWREPLESVGAETVPNDLIAEISEDLLARFKNVPLLDEYAVYEQFMSYWHESMHDDVVLIMGSGWVEASKPRLAIDDKERKLKEEPDLVIGTGKKASKFKMDLIPPKLIVDRYFADDQRNLDDLIAQADQAAQELESFLEENAGEDGLLAEAMEDEKISKALVAKRLKAAKLEGEAEEITALNTVSKLYAADDKAKKAVKETQAELDEAVLGKYPEILVSEIKQIVVVAKWNSTVAERIDAAVNVLIQGLVSRLNTLGVRYKETLGDVARQHEFAEKEGAEIFQLLGLMND